MPKIMQSKEDPTITRIKKQTDPLKRLLGSDSLLQLYTKILKHRLERIRQAEETLSSGEMSLSKFPSSS